MFDLEVHLEEVDRVEWLEAGRALGFDAVGQAFGHFLVGECWGEVESVERRHLGNRAGLDRAGTFPVRFKALSGTVCIMNKYVA